MGTGRRRPSGAGGNSKRLATVPQPDGQEIKIPTARAAMTAWYVADADGNWPAKDTLMIDDAAPWLREDDYIVMVEMRPGHGMGDETEYRVAEIRNHIRRFPGRYGQSLRLVLLVPVAVADSVGELDASDLEVN